MRYPMRPLEPSVRVFETSASVNLGSKVAPMLPRPL